MVSRILVLIVLSAACGRIGYDSVDASDATDADPIDADPAMHLVGWWKLDDGTGGFALDSSSYGNTGTLTSGVTWGTGMRGGAADFDGSNDENIGLGYPSHLALTGSMTLAAWFFARNYDLGSLADDALISRDDITNNHSGWSLKGSEDCGPQNLVMQIAEADNGPLVQRCSTAVLATGIWYHAAGVFDADRRELHVYLNGVQDDGILLGSVPTSLHQAGSAIHVEIGNQNPRMAGPTGGTATFDGLIDDVRVYDIALTPAQIAELVQ